MGKSVTDVRAFRRLSGAGSLRNILLPKNVP